MMNAFDDRALVAAFLRSRSEDAFLRLYHRHTDSLYRFAARLAAGGPGFEPAEIVQEAWVRAIERLDQFGWRSSLRTVRLAAGIAGLPAGYREILVLHDVEGFTHAEIAREFGISEGTSKSQLHRARQALRELLRSGGERNHG